jgi:hypothetical protein
MHARVLASRYNRSGHAEVPAVFRMHSRSWLLNTCRCGPIKCALQRTCVTVATTPGGELPCDAHVGLAWQPDVSGSSTVIGDEQ